MLKPDQEINAGLHCYELQYSALLRNYPDSAENTLGIKIILESYFYTDARNYCV